MDDNFLKMFRNSKSNIRVIAVLPQASVVRVVPIGTRYDTRTRTGYYRVLPGTNEIPIPTTAAPVRMNVVIDDSDRPGDASG